MHQVKTGLQLPETIVDFVNFLSFFISLFLQKQETDDG
jgi:hypothetical protein